MQHIGIELKIREFKVPTDLLGKYRKLFQASCNSKEKFKKFNI